MPDLKLAELIDGVVYITPPVSFTHHAGPHFNMVAPFGIYNIATPGVDGGNNSSIRLDHRNMPQPDICLITKSSHGGQTVVDGDGYLSGAPELIVEISNTSAGYDSNQKREVYRRNRVREYFIWRTIDDEFTCLRLVKGRYETLAADESGVVKSVVYLGLWLDVYNILHGDWQAVIGTTQRGIASPEHAAFVQQLAATAAAKSKG